MSRIRCADTQFETKVFKELRRRGVYFQTNYCRVIGKPDIALPRRRRAVFLHSAFWHGWRLPAWEHILPSEFWRTKLRKNRKRDRLVRRQLRAQGWDVLVVWEHQINRNFYEVLERIVTFLDGERG